MKLIIDLPDNYILSNIKNGSIASQMILNAVKNGTPLPKGHGRLIDVSEYCDGSFNDAREFLDNATTIIEADKAESEDKE